MALLIAFNAAAINTDERAREHATMFAYGVTIARVLRGSIAEALIIGALGTAAGHASSARSSTPNMPETMPHIGTLTAVTPVTYALATAAGTITVATAPLLTVHRLRHADPLDAPRRRISGSRLTDTPRRPGAGASVLPGSGRAAKRGCPLRGLRVR